MRYRAALSGQCLLSSLRRRAGWPNDHDQTITFIMILRTRKESLQPVFCPSISLIKSILYNKIRDCLKQNQFIFNIHSHSYHQIYSRNPLPSLSNHPQGPRNQWGRCQSCCCLRDAQCWARGAAPGSCPPSSSNPSWRTTWNVSGWKGLVSVTLTVGSIVW